MKTKSEYQMLASTALAIVYLSPVP